MDKVVDYKNIFIKIEKSEELTDVLDGVYHLLMNTLVKFKIKNCEEHQVLLNCCQQISGCASSTEIKLPARFSFLNEISAILEETKNG